MNLTPEQFEFINNSIQASFADFRVANTDQMKQLVTGQGSIQDFVNFVINAYKQGFMAGAIVTIDFLTSKK